MGFKIFSSRIMAKPSHIRWKWGQIMFLYFWVCYKLFQMNLAGFIWIVTSWIKLHASKKNECPSGKPTRGLRHTIKISFNYLTYSTNKGCKRLTVSGKRSSTNMALENKRPLDTVIAQITGGFERHSAFKMAIWPRWQGCNQPISTCGCNQNVQLTKQNKQHVDSINPKIERVIKQKY